MNRSATAVSHSAYWTEHAEAWANISEAEAQYVGDLAMEEFYADLADAASYLAEHHFN